MHVTAEPSNQVTLSTCGTQQPVVFGYEPEKRVCPRNNAVPMRLVSMLALTVSRTPMSAYGFPLTVPCSGLRFVLWEGAAVPKLVTLRGIFFQRGPL